MRYLSVASGIEAASVAWSPLGWRAVGFSEIEPFPSRLLQHHYPDVTNFGDMNNYKEWDVEPFDVLIGGTPCQSFSSAGLRRGLDDPRGNLALVFCGLVDRFRPRYVIWENVPGALSSSGGRDFGSIVGALVELGYGVCWRVLDAKHFGVAQRRRRVFLVASVDGWHRAAATLFESESSLRNPAPRRQRQEELAPPLKKGFGDGRGSDDPLCWWDGGQLSQTADAVLYKKQTMPEKNRFPACFEGEHVRFLMPEEWELLQGFPWGYTDVPGALASDRYKALGNSFPVPVIRWLGERIQFVESL